MKVLGIVTEYNPFHNGHLYHLTESKRISGADCAVCVMSGNFTQRGEPAVVDKWARAKMALASGIDLVLELPVVYAMSSAEHFAAAAVAIMNATDSIDFISFGSETGSIEELNRIAVLLADEPAAFKSSLRGLLDSGLSFAAARQQAVREILPRNAAIMDSPNNILGIEYLKALYRSSSRIAPLTVKRKGGEYRDTRSDSPMPGATAIREVIKEAYAGMNHTWDSFAKKTVDMESLLAPMVPQASADILRHEFAAGRGPVFIGDFGQTLLSILRRSEKSDIAAVHDISEGLENRIKEASRAAGTMDELLTAVYTKRYPATRVRRTLLHLMTGITAADFIQFETNGGPQYIRILGFNGIGRQLLSKMRKKALLPVLTKFAGWQKHDAPLIAKMASIESTSTDIYVLAFANPSQRKAGQEYTANTIRF